MKQTKINLTKFVTYYFLNSVQVNKPRILV